MAAPVCHVPGGENINQPDPKRQPSIPIATDLASALAAINALRQIVNSLLNASRTQAKGGIISGKVVEGFVEVKRVTEQVKVENPTDPSQYVIVERTKQLVMGDKKTGGTWTYQL